MLLHSLLRAGGWRLEEVVGHALMANFPPYSPSEPGARQASASLDYLPISATPNAGL